MFNQKVVQLFCLCLDASEHAIFAKSFFLKTYLTVRKLFREQRGNSSSRESVYVLQRRLNLSDCWKNVLITPLKEEKALRMSRVRFSAWLYLIGWLIIFPVKVFCLQLECPFYFVVKDYVKVLQYFPAKRGTPSKHWLNTMHHISALLWFFFFFSRENIVHH